MSSQARGAFFMGGGEKLASIDKNICTVLKTTGKWTKDCCSLCRSRKGKCSQKEADEISLEEEIMDNKTDKKEIVIPQGSAPADMIRMAVAGKADLTQLKELLSLQREWEANEARKAYHKAMAAFKANPPKIDKDKDVAYGNTKYSHASLGNVTEKINAELSKHGLSASWTTKQNGQICVTCKITHEFGHSEETTLCAPSDTSGAKNAIQAIGSTITYLERYSLLALTGLATYDQDDDGRAAGAPVEFISEKEQHQLADLLIVKNISEKQFFEYMKVSALAEIPKAKFQQAVTAINTAKKIPVKK